MCSAGQYKVLPGMAYRYRETEFLNRKRRKT